MHHVNVLSLYVERFHCASIYEKKNKQFYKVSRERESAMYRRVYELQSRTINMIYLIISNTK